MFQSLAQSFKVVGFPNISKCTIKQLYKKMKILNYNFNSSLSITFETVSSVDVGKISLSSVQTMQQFLNSLYSYLKHFVGLLQYCIKDRILQIAITKVNNNNYIKTIYVTVHCIY